LSRPGGKRRILDVKGAYFEGHFATPEECGRVIYIPVPAGWDELGYPPVTNNMRNWFQVSGNIPGLRDAGRIWEIEYDSFLLGYGFEQSIVDRRVFVLHLPHNKLFIIAVYVDDNWTFCDDDQAWDKFLSAWTTRFTSSENTLQAANDFCGLTFTDKEDGSIEISCEKLMTALDDVLAPHDIPTSYSTPLEPDALTIFRQPPSADNPLLPHNVPFARAILGLGMFIAQGVRPDTLISAVALSSYIVTNLTSAVWNNLLRWANYLTHTRDLRLILRPAPSMDFMATSDSSAINIPTTTSSTDLLQPEASMGGYALFFPGSGVFAAECFSPRKLGDSSAAAELIMLSWAAKGSIAFRMQQRQLRCGPHGPTTVEVDAKAVTDGVLMEKVSRRQRYNSARLAMIRQWITDDVLALWKTKTTDMRSDILTKIISPASHHHRLTTLLLTGKNSNSNSN